MLAGGSAGGVGWRPGQGRRRNVPGRESGVRDAPIRAATQAFRVREPGGTGYNGGGVAPPLPADRAFLGGRPWPTPASDDTPDRTLNEAFHDRHKPARPSALPPASRRAALVPGARAGCAAPVSPLRCRLRPRGRGTGPRRRAGRARRPGGRRRHRRRRRPARARPGGPVAAQGGERHGRRRAHEPGPQPFGPCGRRGRAGRGPGLFHAGVRRGRPHARQPPRPRGAAGVHAHGGRSRPCRQQQRGGRPPGALRVRRRARSRGVARRAGGDRRVVPRSRHHGAFASGHGGGGNHEQDAPFRLCPGAHRPHVLAAQGASLQLPPGRVHGKRGGGGAARAGRRRERAPRLRAGGRRCRACARCSCTRTRDPARS